MSKRGRPPTWKGTVSVNYTSGTLTLRLPLRDLKTSAQPERFERLLDVYRKRGYLIRVKGGP